MKRARVTQEASDAKQQAAIVELQAAFARYQDELLGMLYYLVGNIEDAKDALQETFLKCWRHRRGVEEVENLKAWLFRIALNTGRDVRKTAWRRHRRALSQEEHTIAAATPSPETDAVRREQLETLRRALKGLRPEEQEVFLLRQNADMTYDQIAQSIGIPTGTAKTRMRLALTKLREAIHPSQVQ